MLKIIEENVYPTISNANLAETS